MKITLRFPTAAYAYAEVEVEGDSGAELEYKLGEVAKAAGLAIQMTGGGDSASIAERLLRDEMGAVRISEEQPGLLPDAPAQAAPVPWENTTPAPIAPWAQAEDTRPAPPWAAAPSAPANPYGAAPAQHLPTLVKLPFGKAGTEQEQKNKWVKDFAFQQRNKLVWNKERKGFEFERTPDTALLAEVTSRANQVGGSVE